MTEIRSLRQRPENRVIRLEQRQPGSAQAQLIVDQQHRFFFDHPHDHIPGLLLLEGSHQIVQQLLPRDGLWFATGLQASFNKYCLLDAPVLLDAHIEAELDGWLCQVTVSQHQEQRAAMSWQFVPLPSEMLMQAFGGNGAAVEKSLVNKHRAENVMIAEPYPLRKGGFECHALVPHRDNLLADSDGQMHPLALLETFMQLQRCLNHAESVRLRDILLGVSMSQRLPLRVGSAFHMRTDSQAERDEGKHFSRGADLWAAGRCFARCDMHTGRIRRAKERDQKTA